MGFAIFSNQGSFRTVANLEHGLRVGLAGGQNSMMRVLGIYPS